MGLQPENRDNPSLPGLYVHVPFCVKKCPYCSFYSTSDLHRTQTFIAALGTEISLTRAEGLVFDTLYFGGGTPSVLKPDQIATVMKDIGSRFCLSGDVETTLEMNPGTFTPRFLDTLLQVGVNRIHLGVQSFNDSNLRFLERIHSSGEACRALEILRTHEVGNLGIDLIFGLPDQSLEDWQADLNTALSFQPEHLSCYMLSYEPNTPFHRRHRQARLERPNPATARKLFEETVHFLTENGYDHYEISNFAREKRFRSKHNQKYWHHIPYLGLGPSAHSFLEPRRWWNSPNLENYLAEVAKGRLPVAGSEVLNPGQLMLESIFLGLRTSTGIELKCFEARFGVSFTDEFRDILTELRRLKLIDVLEDRTILTTKGMIYSDSVTSMFADKLDLEGKSG